jgi:5'-3' exonuclease
VTLEKRSVRDLLALLPAQGSRHMMAFDLAAFTRRSWHGHVNEHRNEPEKAAPTAIRQVARLLRGRQPTCVVVAGEGPDLFRSKLYAGYKAGRPPKPPGLIIAERAVKTALSTAGIAPYCVRGLEADDVLHAATIIGRMGRMPVVVVTEDKDADQLVDDEARVLVWDRDEVVKDETAVQARWGVPPKQLVELFALAGDPGDGFPGVEGWGPKTAAKLLCSSNGRRLETLLKDGGHYWVLPKWQKKFVENLEVIKMSYDLARLRGQWLSERPQFEATVVDSIAVADHLVDAANRLTRQHETR